MNDQDNWRDFFSQYGLTPKVDEAGCLVFEAKHGGIDGYVGFVFEAQFKDGIFTGIWIGE